MIARLSREIEPVGYELMEAPCSLHWLGQQGRQLKGGRAPHADGWGVAYREKGMIRIIKKGTAAAHDEDLAQLAQTVHTDLFIAHVRKASSGTPLNQRSAHPFEKAGLTMVHNGTIHNFLEEDDERSDTRRYLSWLIERWDRSDTDLVRVLGEAASTWDYTSICFLMTDGQKLYALRQTQNDLQHLRYFTLYLKVNSGEITISSEPLDENPEWREFDNGTLLIVDSPDSVKWFSIGGSEAQILTAERLS